MTFHAKRTRTAAETLLITVLILASFFPARAVAQATDPDPASTPPAGAPTLSVQAAGATSVTAAWTAVEGATGYALFRYDSEWAQIGGDTLTGTTYTDTGLTTGQQYYYAVAAVNAAGRGPWSENVPITLSSSAQTPPASAPTLSVQAAGATSVMAAWTAVEGATGYALYRYDTEWVQIGGGTLTGTTHTDTGLTTGQQYYYAVAAVNAAGRGPWSESVPVTPAPPADNMDRAALEALYNAADGPNWKNSANWLSDRPLGEWHGVTTDSDGRVTALALRENGLSGSIPSELGNLANLTGLYLAGNQLSGCIPAVMRNVQYNDLDQLGLSFCSTSSTPPAGAPTLSVQAAGATSVTAAWTAVWGATGYALYRYDTEWAQVGGGTLTGTTYTDTGLTAGQTYYYAVAAVNSAGRGPWSESVPVTAAPPANTDRVALVAFYIVTAGPNWANNSNWLSDRPLGEWHGVTTDSNGRVTSLDLISNQLSGTIPPELGHLANLIGLDLWGNQLSGEIPSELGHLAKLTRLSLGGNQLSGEIPSELGNLAKLTRLSLGGNQLSGEIPSELGNLAKLTELNLYNNQLSGEIPSELGNLAKLIRLELWDNQLSGEIPSELGNLAKLTYLGLGDNQLGGEIPSELGNLAKLTSLSLDENQLSGSIPSELGNLAKLTSLSLDENQLSGSIPSELGNLAKLTYLGLGDNQLSGEIPSELGNLANLTSLSLSGNQLSGEIPSELGNLTNLIDLRLYRNQLSGSIPSELSNLANLIDLRLYRNQLSGTIPSELGNLAKLTQLWLSSNQLSGEIPSELGNLANLTSLLLAGNQLSGEIPSELGNLTNLIGLYLAGNQLSGCIPAVLRNVQYNDLDQLGLSFCAQTPPASAPTLSVQAAGATSVRAAWTAVWGATGYALYRYDTEWVQVGGGTLTATTYTDTGLTTGQTYSYAVAAVNAAGRGPWSESVPVTAAPPANTDRVALVAFYIVTNGPNWRNNSNWLSDRPLGEWHGVTIDSNGRVTSLILVHNQLSGTIPPELGNLANLTELYLSSNQLSGEIPSELGNLANLTYLDLHENQLSGEIPSQLGNLTNLTWLYLFSNQLSGSIPSELGNLSNLTHLNLWVNQLSGEIPSELGNLANLTVLWLAGNQLSGCIPAALQNVQNNDLDQLGLSFCSA